jgi:hypothetical protein
MIKRLCLKVLFCVLFGISGASSAAIISPGTPTTTVPPELADGSYLAPPGITVTLGANQFLLPVVITGALNTPNFVFDLTYDSSVVQQVDPLDFLDTGIYGARFTPGNPNSLSFILSGFAFNFLGLVDDVAGEYPSLLNGITGDGVLAYILFETLPGQEGANPGFAIENAVAQIEAPEPNTLALFAAALLILTFTRRRLGRVRLPKARG